MITFTNEEVQHFANNIEELAFSIPAPNQFTPQFVELANALRSKLHEYPKNKVHPYEFLKAVEGKEEFVGMPVIWAEWPTKEEA